MVDEVLRPGLMLALFKLPPLPSVFVLLLQREGAQRASSTQTTSNRPKSQLRGKKKNTRLFLMPELSSAFHSPCQLFTDLAPGREGWKRATAGGGGEDRARGDKWSSPLCLPCASLAQLQAAATCFALGALDVAVAGVSARASPPLAKCSRDHTREGTNAWVQERL